MNSSPKQPSFYEFDDVRVDVDAREIIRNGRRISLTPKVFEMLLIFLDTPGVVLEKSRMMELLWPDSFVEESNLTQNVAVLRKALGDASLQHRMIVTVPGRGYRFAPRVKELFDAGRQEEMTPETAIAMPTGRRWPFFVLALGVLAAGALAYFLWIMSGPDRKDPEIGRTLQITTWSGLDVHPALSPDGDVLAYSSDRSGTFEIYLRQLLPTAREVQLTSDGFQNFQPAFSPDGNLLAFHSKLRGGIWLMPTTGGNPRQLSQFGSNPAWSPDGQKIAFQSDPLSDLGSSVRNALPPSTVWIVPSSGGEPKQVTKPGSPPGGHGAPAFSPDGRKLVFDVNDWATSSLAILDVASESIRSIDNEGESASDPVYSSDGKSIYYIGYTGTSLKRLSITAEGEPVGESVKLFDASGTRIRAPSVDSSGRRMVYAALATASNIWMTQIGEKPKDPVPLTKYAYARTVLPTFSPDGKRIAYQSFTTGPGLTAHIWLMNSDGSDQARLTSRAGFNPWWTPDGTGLWFVSVDDSRHGMWHISVDTRLERKLFDFDEETYTARPSPDGTIVAFNSKRGGAMNIWLVPMSGGEPRQFTFDSEFAGFPSWSPDGKWMAFQLKRGDDTHAAIIPTAGAEVTQLTFERGQTWIHDWSPDNDKIIFAGQRNGVWNVYSVSRSTREIRQMTSFTKLNSYVRYPTWSPMNDRIAYEYAETTGNIWMVEFK